MMFGMKRLLTEWQVGDGRETRLADYVVARALLPHSGQTNLPADQVKQVSKV